MNIYHYISFDPPGVQRLIFQTQKLKEIRAVSAMLEHAGQEELKALIAATQSKPLRLAGGGGEVFVPTQHKDTFLRQLKAILAQHLPGVPFVIRDLPHREGDNPQLTQQAASRIHRMPELLPTPLLGPCSLACASCRFGPATCSVAYSDRRPELLCQRCYDKRDPNRPESEFQKQLRQLAAAHDWPQNLAFANDLIDIANQTKTRKQYLALICLDANRMGQYFQEKLAELKGLEDCEGYKRHSDRVKAQMVKAFAKAVLITWPKPNAMVPAEMLYLGGDDAVMICAADRALQLARNLVQNFAEDSILKAFSLSIGIVFARHNTPMFSLIELGQDLVASAKRRAKLTEGDPPSMIDFEVMLGQASADLEDLRKELDQGDVLRTAKPYSVAELMILEDSVGALGPIDGRLYDLEAACESRSGGTLAAIKLLGRMNKDDFKLLTQQFQRWRAHPPSETGLGFPWTEKFRTEKFDPPAKPVTLVRDVLELIPFLEAKHEHHLP